MDYVEKATEFVKKVDLNQYYEQLKNTNYEELISNLDYKSTSIILSISVLLLTLIIGSTTKAAPKPKKKKRISKTEKALKQIKKVEVDFNDDLKPKIEEFIESKHATLKSDEVAYNYRFYEEALLKKLLELDEIDCLGNEDLRLARKNAIKSIQTWHKNLDLFKKEKKF